MFSRSFFCSLGMLASLPYAFMSVVGMRVGDGVGGAGVESVRCPLWAVVTWRWGLGWCALKH